MDAPPVRYARTSDGYDIAYTVAGDGQPLIFLPPSFHSVQSMWRHFPDWMQGLAERFRVITIDARGEGLSTRGLPEETAVTDYVLDLQAVTERFKGERFLLFAQGGRGHDALRYADLNPDRVAAMIWLTASVRNSSWSTGLFRTLPNENWQAFLAALVPSGLSVEERRQRIQDYDDCIRLEDRNVYTRTHFPSDIEQELRRLRAPLLVMHPKDFVGLPIAESMKVAALASNARFVPLDDASGNLMVRVPVQGLAAIDAFVADLQSPEDPPAISIAPGRLQDGLSERELEVLRRLAQGKSNPQIAEALFITRNTVQNHVSSILIKTNLTNRAQAAVYAKEHGIA